MRNTLGTLTWREPRIVALALLVILAAGLSALVSIGRQEDPTITNIFATVTTAYPGADPARVESLVTVEVEKALQEIPEVDTIETTSATGISIVSVELVETIADERIEQVWSEIRDALSDVALPRGAVEPELSTDGGGAFGAIVALTSSRDGAPLTLVGRYAEALGDTLRAVPGTKMVELYGLPEEEITVTLNAARASALGLSAAQVARAVEAADAKLRAGAVTGEQDELVVEVAGEIESLARLSEIVLRDGAEGSTLRLGDIAQITRGPRTPMAEAALQDGRPAILVAAKLEDGLQVDAWASDIRAALAEYETGLPGGMDQELVFDQSTYTADRLAEVGTNMALGVGLVVVVLFVTLGVRAALIVALILPLVSLASLATMNAIGLPIHQMSVTGMIVALGLLVDAGIVMTDEIGRRLRTGAGRARAVGDSVSRLAMPLFASTVTTALSFLPMILLPGPAGDFVGSIAMAVVIMLGWSFVVAVAITPAIAGWFLPDQSKSTLSNGLPAGVLGRVFAATLGWSVRNPVRSIALALVLPVLGFASLPLLTAQFFPGVERDQFTIEVDMAPGTALSATQGVIARLDAALRAQDEIDRVTWLIGRSAPAFYYNIVGDRDGAPGYAHALIRTTSANATDSLLPELQRNLPTLAPEAQVLVRGLVQGPPVNAPVELRIVGPDIAVLREEGVRLRQLVAAQDAVTLARASITEGAPKLVLDMDEAEARRLGLSLADVAGQMEAALVGITGGSLIEGTEELPVRVRLGDALRADPSAIRDMGLLPSDAIQRSVQGAYPALPLSAVAEVRLEPGQGTITRRNGERANTVEAFLLQGVLPEEALAEIRVELEARGFALPSGYRLEIGGDSDARNSTLQNLLAPLGLIVTLSIAVVVMTFRSFRLAAVALVVSGLSAGLSMLALAIFQYPFGINAIIGLIGSIGVSINAALIIMTALQENPDAAAGNPEAMVGVVMDSTRHIVSTTITTVGGFLPLILAGGGFWPPFAMAVAGGVLLSTVVSFYFTPAAFRLVYARERTQTQVHKQTPIPFLQAAE
ncbi:MAG: efflux RND transporter permease subunit [Marivita sp.]|uniref:efflux RND transporter permease subunit n=1 Tax=Marivita sp. TaxID=2003365 RepID=UPI0025BEBA98|nr:efflux RND transporter permease subunit [Marivita sp.]MCI5108967.1 efflux RND transporter permease subunit [Marivita sp.]